MVPTVVSLLCLHVWLLTTVSLSTWQKGQELGRQENCFKIPLPGEGEEGSRNIVFLWSLLIKFLQDFFLGHVKQWEEKGGWRWECICLCIDMHIMGYWKLFLNYFYLLMFKHTEISSGWLLSKWVLECSKSACTKNSKMAETDVRVEWEMLDT